MIKANQTFLNFMQMVFDMLTVALSLLLAYWIRFVSPFYTDGVRVMDYVSYLHLLFFILPVYAIMYFIFGLYRPFRKVRFYKQCQRIFGANTVAIMVTVTYLYYTKDVNFSRLMLGYFYLGSNLFMFAERLGVRTILRKMRKKGFNQKHILVVGAGLVGRSFVEKIRDERELGYNVIGFVDDYYPKEERDGIPILGTTMEMERILNTNYVDEVVIALPNTSYKKINRVIDTCEYSGVKTQVIPDYINLLQGSQASFDELDGIPLINTRYIPLDNPFNNGLKRAIDLASSLILVTVLSPVMLLTAIGVKLSSPGPVIYKQTRVGKDRKEFTIYKFRSMVADQPNNGATGWTQKNDPRRTKFGTFIRKFSIDELPQLFNVIKGEMSLIGPRPELPFWVDEYKDTIPHYMIKHHVRPGITGLAQVHGWRGDTSVEERIKDDIRYIENWSLWLDIKIVLMTPKAMVSGS